jgi:hypothetical protein
MHPDVLRELISQHGRELREQAHRATMARTASRARRAARHGNASPDQAADSAIHDIPVIPDYVDGSFRPARDEAASRVPAGRHAA